MFLKFSFALVCFNKGTIYVLDENLRLHLGSSSFSQMLDSPDLNADVFNYRDADQNDHDDDQNDHVPSSQAPPEYLSEIKEIIKTSVKAAVKEELHGELQQLKAERAKNLKKKQEEDAIKVSDSKYLVKLYLYFHNALHSFLLYEMTILARILHIIFSSHLIQRAGHEMQIRNVAFILC